VPTTPAYLADDPSSPLGLGSIERRAVGPQDVRIDIDYCGVCHSDLHMARNEWGATTYPVVPGHEIVGRVAEVGADVTQFAIGDRVGVGCLVGSCGSCDECEAGLEQYCRRTVGTYNAVDPASGERTYGGYSTSIVVTDRFVLRVPADLDAASAAPILCAGITMYSPLRHHAVGPGSTVAIAGFGGLGSLGVKLAKALGAEVTVVSRSDRKSAEAYKAGADSFVDSADVEQMRGVARKFDVVLSTIPTDHDIAPYLRLLKRDGVYVVLGAVEPLTRGLHGGVLTARRVSVTGSMIGGIPETQELLDFCAAQGVSADVEVIAIEGINAAYDKLHAGDPGHRYVIDMSTLSN
jgi:uncharacterized zinc-type alcohol dehydrogenase-like protein